MLAVSRPQRGVAAHREAHVVFRELAVHRLPLAGEVRHCGTRGLGAPGIVARVLGVADEVEDFAAEMFSHSEHDRWQRESMSGAEFLKQKMIHYGLENVRIEEFSLASWERGSASLKLVSPVERDFSVVAMPLAFLAATTLWMRRPSATDS